MPRGTYNLLLLEDEETEIERFKRNLSEFAEQEANPRIFVPFEARTVEAAENILQNHYIDCAMIDLRVPPRDG